MSGVGERPERPVGDAAATPVAVEVELTAGSRLQAVCRLVAAGVAGRHEVTVDRIDELQLAIDAALRQPPASELVSMRLVPADGELWVELGPLVVAPSDRPALERVLSTLVTGATTREVERQTWVEMRIPVPEAERG